MSTAHDRKPRCLCTVDKNGVERTCLRVANCVHPDYPNKSVCKGCHNRLSEATKARGDKELPKCPHLAFKIKIVHQGWKTGEGECANCGCLLRLEFKRREDGHVGAPHVVGEAAA